MKRILLSSVLLVFVLASCDSAQQQDQKKSDEKTQQATTAAEISAEQQVASDVNAGTAAVLAVQAEIDKAMAKVTMPAFKKENAKILATAFHKYLSEMVNANSGKTATAYADKLVGLQDEYNKKIANEKLDTGDKAALDKYVTDMIAAVKRVN
ncbi:MAG: hypothetical protein J0I41_09680 [Filimonas sp.]|nr:hypothetical protein [Filimonas sp.]